MRVGLVLGAGGVTGDAFHRGVLRALRDTGVDPRDADVVVGTSAGAMVGAQLRRQRGVVHAVPSGATVHGRRLGRVPELGPLFAAVRRPWGTRPGVLACAMLPTGRHSTEFLAADARRHHGDRWPERPLYLVAVRRRDGRRVVFGRDDAPGTDVAHAVAASCAIPGYFHPVEIDGEMYVDGGVHSPTNADVLRGVDLDVVVVSAPMSLDPRSPRPTLDAGLRLYWHRMLRRELAPLRRAGVAVCTVEPGGALLSVLGVNPLHGGRVDEIEELAHDLAASRFAATPMLRPGARRDDGGDVGPAASATA